MSKVLVNFIQDRSGSMASAWEETLSGYRAFVDDLRQKSYGTDVEYLFSLTTFDTLVETPIVAARIGEVDVDELKKHGPRGMTALYDAVGITIKNTEDNPQGAEKIIVVIVTDGQENSSREWSKEKLNKAIDMKLGLGNWTFTYLGTQPETWDDAAKIGVGAGSTRSYQPSMARAAYTTTAGAIHGMSVSKLTGSRSLMDDFADDDEATLAGMKKGPVSVRPAPEPPESKSPKPENQMNQSQVNRWR
jgi:uncharacterized protein YegL